MIKKRWIISMLVVIAFGILGNFQCFAYQMRPNSHPYHIYLINNSTSGMLLEIANIKIKDRTIEITYMPMDFGEVKSSDLKIGEIIGDFKDIREIQTIKIENTQILSLKQNYIKVTYPLKEFREGMTFILWVGNVVLQNNKVSFNPLVKEQLLERADTISWEQLRLGFIDTYLGGEVMNNEVNRNYEE
jgi:hypothetical protein